MGHSHEAADDLRRTTKGNNNHSRAYLHKGVPTLELYTRAPHVALAFWFTWPVIRLSCIPLHIRPVDVRSRVADLPVDVRPVGTWPSRRSFHVGTRSPSDSYMATTSTGPSPNRTNVYWDVCHTASDIYWTATTPAVPALPRGTVARKGDTLKQRCAQMDL